MLKETVVRIGTNGPECLFMEPEDDFNEDDFYEGYNAAWDEFSPDKPIGDPVAGHEYRLGWWTGVEHSRIWHEGWDAYEKRH